MFELPFELINNTFTQKPTPLSEDEKNILAQLVKGFLEDENANLKQMVQQTYKSPVGSEVEKNACLIAVRLLNGLRQLRKDRYDETVFSRIQAVYKKIHSGEKDMKKIGLNLKEFAIIRELASLASYFNRLDSLDVIKLDKSLYQTFKTIQQCHEILVHLENVSKLSLHIELDKTDQFIFGMGKPMPSKGYSADLLFTQLKEKGIISDGDALTPGMNHRP